MLSDSFVEEVGEEFGLILSQVILEIKKELRDQGHVLTGRLERSIELEIEKKPNLIRGLIYMLDYGFTIDQGVSAIKVPYTPSRRGAGRGGKSKYIEGLYTFWLLKGLGRKEALNAAFATANKHSKEGIPTKDSFVHSTNGRRLSFFSGTLDRLSEEIQATIENKGQDLVTSAFNKVMNKFAANIAIAA